MAAHRPWVPSAPGPAEAAVGLAAGVAGRAAAPLARAAVYAGLQRIFRPDAGDADRTEIGDDGWFGPESVTWRIHADASMFVAGIAALAFQALHPLAMAGVSDHSDFRVDPLGRLRRTAAFVGVTAYGSDAEATAACGAIRRVHDRVVGYAPDGRAYAANDPELLDWVHVSEFAAFAAAYRRFGGDPLTARDLDRYVAEVARIGVALGDPSPPASWDELHAALERHRPNLAVTEQTRAAWRFLAAAPVPGPARPAYRLLFGGAQACLPPWARRLWGVPDPSTAEVAACRAVVRGLGALLGEPPRLAAAKARIAGDRAAAAAG